MVEEGKVIAVKLSADAEERVMFRTKDITERYGQKYYVFCNVKPLEEVTLTDFWAISESYFSHLKEEGMLREIERWCDL